MEGGETPLGDGCGVGGAPDARGGLVEEPLNVDTAVEYGCVTMTGMTSKTVKELPGTPRELDGAMTVKISPVVAGMVLEALDETTADFEEHAKVYDDTAVAIDCAIMYGKVSEGRRISCSLESSTSRAARPRRPRRGPAAAERRGRGQRHAL